MEKKLLIGFAGLLLSALAGIFGLRTSAQAEFQSPVGADLVSPNLVVSQFQVAGATATDEFIELHNIGASAVDLNGYRVVYRSAGGVNDVPMVEWTTSTVVPAGGFYLIATSTYTGTVPSNINYNTATVSMAAAGGGIAIRQGAANTGTIIDSVGYGSATNIFVEGTATAAPPTSNSRARTSNGCTDTDNNSADFAGLNPSAPRNAATAPITCSGGGTTLFAAITANPTTVAPGGTVLFNVTVIPATTPPSTGIAVSANLTNLGGAPNQMFFDDGTNGDTTPGDNIFSYTLTVPLTVTGGPVQIPATAIDAQSRSVTRSVTVTVNAPNENDNPLLFGNPSNATASIANENNYLMVKPQYSLSYNRSTATPNWVAWRLDSTWLGSAPRQDDYRADTTLPVGWYQVQDNDYSGSGFDRGHMCPSGDRTRSIADNSATFLMTNFVPQFGPNNQGPWNDFENYCRSLANSGNEIYIITGPVGSAGTIASGRVTVPQFTWKVVLILPNGNNDLSRVTRATRAFGIVVPNFGPITSNAWRNYRVTVDAVEVLTGHNFFSAIPINTQMLIERRRDLL